ncbi:MAG: hypothetical protein J6S85_23990 [Methanobrevibacter sp.]|nr:hypothetical protein [Methanobrevibacter sp.]
MKWHKRKWSEFTYRDIARSLIWYYWDYIEEDDKIREKYERLWKNIKHNYFDRKI